MTEETKLTAADNYDLLSLLYDIRVAAGDKEGRLMQSELLAHISAMRLDASKLKERAIAVFNLYPSHWDLVEGGLFVDQSKVEQFDKAFTGLGVALGLLVDEDPEIDAARAEK